MSKNHHPQVCVISLGCPKNLVDTETMVGRMLPQGYRLEGDPEQADLFLVNTCSFVEAARRETMDTITDCLRYKQDKNSSFSVLVKDKRLSSKSPRGLFKRSIPNRVLPCGKE